MKKMKRVISLILTGCLLFLTACSNGESNGATPGSNGEGRYVETEITPPIEGRFSSFLASDGTIICFSDGLMARYESNDGGATWNESPGPGQNTNRYLMASIGSLLPDGRLLVYIQNEGLFAVSADGDEHIPVAEIDSLIAEGGNASISLMQVLADDRLVLNYFSGGMMMIGNAGGGARAFGNRMEVTESEEMEFSGEIELSGEMELSAESETEFIFDSADEGSDSSTTVVERTQTFTAGGAGPGMMTMKTLLIDIKTGATVAELPIESASSATSSDGNLYLMDSGGTVTSYNLSDGSPASSQIINFGSGQSDAFGAMGGMRGGMINMMGFGGSSASTLATDGKGGLYAMYDSSLLLSDLNGVISTTLASTAYSIGSPRASASSLFILDDDGIVINITDNFEANRLYKYIWDENAVVNPDKTISVWSLNENSFIRAAISELRKKHPDSLITYEVALQGDNAISAADAIKTLNTRMLDGSGPDVIVMDDCPADSYAAKGMLLDLIDLLDTGDIYQNLLASYNEGSKIYYLPTQFYLPSLISDAEALSKARTLDDLVNLVINGNDKAAVDTFGAGRGGFTAIPEEERAALYFENLKELNDILWSVSAPAIIADNKLDKAALTCYLEAIKDISDKYGLAEQDEGGRMGMAIAFASGGSGATMTISSSLIRYTSQMTNYGAFTVSNLMLMQMMMDRDGSELMIFPGMAENAWQPSTLVGVSADTKVPEFAAALVQTMLGTEVQQYNYGTGLPVTKSGIAEQIVQINEQRAEMERDPFTLDMNGLIGQLSTPSMVDTILTDMIWNSIEQLGRGELDVEGAVNRIEQSIKNYLAERS